MAAGFGSYIKAAFNARTLGMPLPLNWVALAGIAIGSFYTSNPGIAILGAGLELAYLLIVASNKRFQRAVDAVDAHDLRQAQRFEGMLKSLPPEDLRRYQQLADSCREFLQQQKSREADVNVQADALSHLVLVYLQLLVTRASLTALLRDDDTAQLPDRIADVERQLQGKSMSPELRNSLEGQLQILQQRLAGRQEAAAKLQFVSAELVRIEEQVELVRDQSVLTSDAATVAERIDAITGSLTQTSQWIRDQQKIVGRLDDITLPAPSLLEPPDQLKA